MSWLTEWRDAGKIRLPKKYNSLKDIRSALKEELTDEDIMRAVRAVNREIDLPGLDEAQEEALILNIGSRILKLLLG